MARVPKPRVSQKPRTGLESDALTSLLEQLDKDISDAAANPMKRFGAVRLKAVMYLCLYYGLRPGEVCGIQKPDYKPDRKVLYARRKHGDITVPLDPDVNAQLVYWLSLREAVVKRGVGELFVTWQGNALSTQSTRSQLAKLANRAGVHLHRGGLHQLRHTMAEIMAGRGDQLTEISRYLGHKNLSSTDHYVRKHFGTKNQTGRDIVRSLLNAARPDTDKVIPLRLVDQDQGDPEDVPF